MTRAPANADHEPAAFVPYRIIVASRLLDVRTPSYALLAERRDSEWRPALSLPAGEETPLMTWTGIIENGALQPFTRMYLVSAGTHAFEVRVETETGRRCHFLGDVRRGDLELRLCGGSPSADEVALLTILREGADLAHPEEVAWPGVRVAVRADLGDLEVRAERLTLSAGKESRAMDGGAPLRDGFVYGAMALGVTRAT